MDSRAAVAKGYLPKELPPVFSSATFAYAAPNLTVSKPTGATTAAKFSLARAGGLRRPAAVPNPFAHLQLTDLCVANWSKLRALSARSSFSASRPLKGGVRHRRSLRFVGGNDRFGRVALTHGARYTLRTDISSFYPSIYTHAVDWAIRGKSVAKRDRSLKSLGARIDKALRDQSDGQTSGICIGPDTSWLIGEVLLSAIDAGLVERFPQTNRRAHRWYDDLTFYARSFNEAEDVLNTYEHLLAEFEMSLNPTKTEIFDGLKLHDDSWLIRLRQARYRDDSEAHLSGDIIDLFSMAFELASDRSSTGAISYAIKRCNPFPGGSAWHAYQHLLLSSVTLEPSCLPHVRDVLVFADEVGLPIDRSLIAETMNDVCSTHSQQDHSFEVSWALSILREFALPLESTSARAVARMSDGFSLLLLLDACAASARLDRSVNLTEVVKRAEASDAFTTDDWLLAYEARCRGWCKPVGWRANPAWRELRDANVRFLTLTVSRRRPRIRRSRPMFLSRWTY